MTINTQRLAHRLSQVDLSLPTTVTKRDGSQANFDIGRIERAVTSCFNSLAELPQTPVPTIVHALATNIASRYGSSTPSVEQIQDLTETTLLTFGEIEAARHYIAYRDEHAKMRGAVVPAEVKLAFEQDAKYFTTAGQRFSFYDKYSRFNWDLERRETWPETVARTVGHLRWEVQVHYATGLGHKVVWLDEESGEYTHIPDEELEALAPSDRLPVTPKEFERIHDAILNMRIMPSMRLLAMAGEAARRNSMALYNCSYLPAKDIQSFVEALLISMAGCGVGFSVERDYVEQFPRVRRQTGEMLGMHIITDTTEGWAEALKIGLETWWSGKDIEFYYDGIRPAGSVLRTKGGRASGPDPLRYTLATLRQIILSRQGSYIRTTDAHLMMCWIGEAAVQGGVRRTAMISLFDWDDAEMRTFKNGPTPLLAQTVDGRSVLWNANNSAVWPEDIGQVDIASQMIEMVKAFSGEPGIFSRSNANKTKPKRRKSGKFGTNPCGEIILRPFEFCNLSQAVSREGDTEADLADKTELATLVGTIQSLSTRFPGLRPEWQKNCEEERLLGVDLTAQNDCELLRRSNPDGAGIRERMVQISLDTNVAYAEKLGINPSVSITCNKPAGNSTEFLGASSNGIHAPHAKYVLRRMIVNTHSPLFRVLKDADAPMYPQGGKDRATATKWIVEFVKETPDGAPVKDDLSAVEQCEFWLLNKNHWTEHNPSCTIDYKQDEVIDLIKWVCDHKDQIGGLSFFPKSDAIYADQPFEEITEDEFRLRQAAWPDVDYSLVYAYEQTDMTTAAQQLSCFAGACTTLE